MAISTAKIEKLFNKFTSSKHIYEATLLLEKLDGSFSISQSFNKSMDAPILAASISKLWTTSLILKLVETRQLDLDTPICHLLPETLTKRLHVYQGKDYSEEITVAHLLFQTSGLPDPFADGQESMKQRLIQADFTFTLQEEADLVRRMAAIFPPGQTGDAYYSDINFDLLGLIVENSYAVPYADLIQTYIANPLGLKVTYALSENNLVAPPTYYKEQSIQRPKFLMSASPSGGGVTTTRELMVFLRAFFTGELFSLVTFSQLQNYNELQASFRPLNYGGGHMHLPLNSLFTLFQDGGALLGHTGSTGSFAFYYPQNDLFFVGDFNQMALPGHPVRFAMQLAMTLRC